MLKFDNIILQRAGSKSEKESAGGHRGESVGGGKKKVGVVEGGRWRSTKKEKEGLSAYARTGERSRRIVDLVRGARTVVMTTAASATH